MPQFFTSLDDVPTRHPTFLAVGVFDGVHRGHQALIQQMVADANSVGARSAILTFFPHPIRVIRELKGRIYLSTLDQRLGYLAALGVDIIITLPFDEETRYTPATDFVETILTTLDVRQFWGGEFSLGYKREGDLAFMQKMGMERGFSVHQLNELVLWNGERVSSSRIRHALDRGDVATVAGCLGRPFTMSGAVVEGRRLGHTIGFPTANVAVWDEQKMPANGVYVTRVHVQNQTYPAATNIGVRPTVNGSGLTVEAHILDFSGDIYGKQITLEFLQFIRAEQKFAGIDALVAQIGADVAQVRQLSLA
jgi:riboflavin kinase/FMN adenylyltransferase